MTLTHDIKNLERLNFVAYLKSVILINTGVCLLIVLADYLFVRGQWNASKGYFFGSFSIALNLCFLAWGLLPLFLGQVKVLRVLFGFMLSLTWLALCGYVVHERELYFIGGFVISFIGYAMASLAFAMLWMRKEQSGEEFMKPGLTFF
jgi:hypothetical protein